MTQSLESFIDKLRTDGVEQGRKAAESIRQEAEEEAKRLVRQAEANARRIVEDAEKQREQILSRAQTDLQLAARDTVAKLRETLSQAVTNVLRKAAAQKLEDAEFLEDLIRETVRQYAQADALGEDMITVNVSEPMRRRLVDWAIKTFHDPQDGSKPSLELHGALSSAGFEYQISGGTVEITPDSVVQALSEIVTPSLRDVIAANSEGESADTSKT